MRHDSNIYEGQGALESGSRSSREIGVRFPVADDEMVVVVKQGVPIPKRIKGNAAIFQLGGAYHSLYLANIDNATVKDNAPGGCLALPVSLFFEDNDYAVVIGKNVRGLENCGRTSIAQMPSLPFVSFHAEGSMPKDSTATASAFVVGGQE